MLKMDVSNLRGDITGGITAGIVALPLALALGVASELGPMAGLYGAIAVGFFAALFGGTPSQISGPTGPMVVVIAGLFSSLSGNIELVFTAIFLAGLFQVLFGVLGIGQYIRLVPYPVISGFMTGIGVIIIILQVGRLLGHETPAGTISALFYIPTALADINVAALGIGLATLLIAYCWPSRFGKYIPGALAALIMGTVISLALNGLPRLGQIPTGLPSLQLPSFNSETLLLVTEAALILAVLGAIDSLLTSLVADNMTRTRHNSSRELIGQGIGNTFAGLIGGVAGAGATMRTVVNVRCGGRGRISGMVHALLLLAIVLGMSPLAAQIPHAVLAGILVKVGLDIIDWGYLSKAHKGPRWDLALMVLVLGLTVFVDLISAVGIGVVLASLAFVKQVAKLQIDAIKNLPEHLDNPKEQQLLQASQGRIRVFDLGGPLSFGAAADISHHVREYMGEGTTALILDFERVPFVDVSAARAVETIAGDAQAHDTILLLSGFSPDVRATLSGLHALEKVNESCIFSTRLEAIEAAVEMTRQRSTPLFAPGRVAPPYVGPATRRRRSPYP